MSGCEDFRFRTDLEPSESISDKKTWESMSLENPPPPLPQNPVKSCTHTHSSTPRTPLKSRFLQLTPLGQFSKRNPANTRINLLWYDSHMIKNVISQQILTAKDCCYGHCCEYGCATRFPIHSMHFHVTAQNVIWPCNIPPRPKNLASVPRHVFLTARIRLVHETKV